MGNKALQSFILFADNPLDTPIASFFKSLRLSRRICQLLPYLGLFHFLYKSAPSLYNPATVVAPADIGPSKAPYATYILMFVNI